MRANGATRNAARRATADLGLREGRLDSAVEIGAIVNRDARRRNFSAHRCGVLKRDVQAGDDVSENVALNNHRLGQDASRELCRWLNCEDMFVQLNVAFEAA